MIPKAKEKSFKYKLTATYNGRQQQQESKKLQHAVALIIEAAAAAEEDEHGPKLMVWDAKRARRGEREFFIKRKLQ
jgi:hypothetical protein